MLSFPGMTQFQHAVETSGPDAPLYLERGRVIYVKISGRLFCVARPIAGDLYVGCEEKEKPLRSLEHHYQMVEDETREILALYTNEIRNRQEWEEFRKVAGQSMSPVRSGEPGH